MAMTFRSRALRSVAFIGLLSALAAPAVRAVPGQETGSR